MVLLTLIFSQLKKLFMTDGTTSNGKVMINQGSDSINSKEISIEDAKLMKLPSLVLRLLIAHLLLTLAQPNLSPDQLRLLLRMLSMLDH
jgi:hypothetical protein